MNPETIMQTLIIVAIIIFLLYIANKGLLSIPDTAFESDDKILDSPPENKKAQPDIIYSSLNFEKPRIIESEKKKAPELVPYHVWLQERIDYLENRVHSSDSLECKKRENEHQYISRALNSYLANAYKPFNQ